MNRVVRHDRNAPSNRTQREPREAVVIVNPVSGDHDPPPVDDIEQQLIGHGITPHVVVTDTGRDAGDIARQAVANHVPLVIVAGGDGTVSQAGRELVHKECALGIIPLGTFNNIARGLSVPQEIDSACAVIGRGRLRAIDVGVVNASHYFFEAAGVGLEAELFPVGEEIKSGRWLRLFDALRLAFRYRARHVTIEFDRTVAAARAQQLARRPAGRRARTKRYIRRKALMTNIANGPYYGSNFAVAPARLDDGVLTISVYHDFNKLDLLRHFRSIRGGRRRYSPRIEQYRAASVRITSSGALPVHADGDPVGTVPATFSVVRAALRVCVP